MKIDGQCHCGDLRFEGVADPANAVMCHCTDCQVLSGTAFRTAVRVMPEDFKLLSGTPTNYVKTTDTGKQTVQAFCGRCGSQIYATHVPTPRFYAVRLGTVRQREEFVPKVTNLGALACAMAGEPRLDPIRGCSIDGLHNRREAEIPDIDRRQSRALLCVEPHGRDTPDIGKWPRQVIESRSVHPTEYSQEATCRLP